jgi:hypothetical protein
VGRRSSVEQTAPAGEGRGGGAVPTWGRAGAVQLQSGEGKGGGMDPGAMVGAA